MLHREKSQ